MAAVDIKVNPGSNNSAFNIALDQIGLTHYPIYKMSYGALGVQTPVDATNPLPVTQSPSSVRDFFFEVSQGNIAGYSAVIKFGENLDVDTAEEDLWSAGGSLAYLTSAENFRIQAGGNAADTAAGTGAREVHITFLDANYAQVTETLATAGASASTSTAVTGLRVLRVACGACGSNESNVGDITIEAVTATTTQALVPAADGQSQQLHYTIPAGKTGYVVGNKFSCVKGGGGGGGPGPGSGTAGIRFRGWVRTYNELSNNNYESWRKIYQKDVTESGGNPSDAPEFLSDPIAEKTDIRITAESDTSNMLVDGRVYIVLKDN